MEHYKLIVAYDGTNYCGFQRQKGFCTIQAEIESALRMIGWKEESIQAAGRTDAGVHASGQVVAFFLEWNHSLETLKAALNSYLPSDIAVQSVEEVTDDFHPRYDAVSREYQYAITLSNTRQPLKERFMWRVDSKLDWQIMEKTAQFFLGAHDFSDFGKKTKKEANPMRRILISKWEQRTESDHIYTICADAFLYHMVRRLVYVMVLAGQGKITMDVIGHAFDGKRLRILPGVAPAHGLTLTKVCYNE